MTPKRAAQLPEYAVSDEAAAYIADALMDLALQFEGAHFSQIRRHHQSIAHDQHLRCDACLIATNKHLLRRLPGRGDKQLRDDDPAQLDLFGRQPPF
jgi:hypothetical protein